MITLFLKIFFIIQFIEYSNSSIFNVLLVHTGFKNISELKNKISKPTFFKSYLHIVNAENVSFEPSIENKSEIDFPLEISYKCRPSIPIFPSNMGSLDIQQIWSMENDEFTGIIKNKYISFDIRVIPFIYKDNVTLVFQGNIIRKHFFVPKQVLNEVLTDMESIFCKILSETCMN